MSLDLIPPISALKSSNTELSTLPAVHEPIEPIEPMQPRSIEVMPKKRAVMTHTVRLLTIDETKALEPIFKDRDVEMPDPATSFFIGAIDSNGNVTENFIVGQLRFHAEPLHLVPGGEHLFRPLARAMYDEVTKRYGTTDVFIFASNEHVVKMADAMGFEQDPWVSMSTRVYGNAINAVNAIDAATPVESSNSELSVDTDAFFRD